VARLAESRPNYLSPIRTGPGNGFRSDLAKEQSFPQRLLYGPSYALNSITNPNFMKILFSLLFQWRPLDCSRPVHRGEDYSPKQAAVAIDRFFLPLLRSPNDQLQVVVIKPWHLNVSR
jgi:hypothetical protein